MFRAWLLRDGDDKRYRPPTKQWQTQVNRRYDYPSSTGPQQYAGSSGNYPTIRNRSDLADEDEMWRLRSRQHSDEMTAAVARARQRREEEEKKFAQSRQAAQEKAKALEEKARNSAEKEKERENTDSDDRSSLSRDSRDEKQANKDFRGANYNANFANKQFPKNIPPRFQKLQQMQQQQQQSPVSNNVQHFSNNRYELVSNQRVTQFEQSPGYGYEVKQPVFNRPTDTDNSDVERQRHDRQQHLEDNWRTQNDFNSRVTEKVSESPNKASTEEATTQIRVQNRRVLQREDGVPGVQRPDSRSSFSSRDEARNKNEEKKHAFERQESSQSSQSDKRSTSSKDDRAKKCERLDWASECDNISIASSNSSSHFGSVKRERHRPVPVVQKHLNVNEPIKSNLTTLKKEDKRNVTNTEVKKPEESAAPPIVTATELSTSKVMKDDVQQENVDNKVLANCDKSSLRNSSTVDVKRSEHGRDSSKKYGRDKTVDKATSQESKIVKSEEKVGDSQKDYNYRQTFRGKEYRRSRGTGDRPKQDKANKEQPYQPRKLSKSRRQTQRSDDSLASEELRKDSAVHKSRTFDSQKSKTEIDSDRYQQNVYVYTSHRDDTKKSRGSFRNSRGRPYGISNYGPPPSKAAFGETKNVSKNVEYNVSESRNEKWSRERNNDSAKPDNAIARDSTNGQNSVGNHVSHKNNSARNQKDNSNNRRAADTVDSTANREESAVPPRFQKKQGNFRSGKGNKQSGGPGRGGDRAIERVRRQRTSSNQESSDIGNDEWETESELSDLERRDGRRNDRIQQHNRKQETKGGRRNEKRRDNNQKGSQQSSHRGQSNRNNRGNSSPSGRDSQSAVKNGPAPLTTKNDTTVLTVSDVIMDNPQAVGEAIADLKERQKSAKCKPGEMDEGFQKVSYKKRFKQTAFTDESDTRKQKPEKMSSPTSKVNARNRFPKLPPRLAKQKETTNKFSVVDDTVLSEKKDDVVKEVKEKVVEHNANAWTKPLSHALQVTSSTVVTTVACTTKPGVKTTSQMGLSSKSSSFDHQDSGIDVSDQPASTASSQRSSPSNDDNTKPVTTTAKPTSTTNVISTSKQTPNVLMSSNVADDLDATKPVTTVIFQNPKLKEENAVLDKFGKPQDKKSEASAKKQLLVNEESSKTISPLSTDCSAKDTFRKLEEDSSKLGFSFKEEKSSQPVNKAVGTPRSGDVLKNSSMSTSADELNQHLKIASVKKVWETTSGLEGNVEECVVAESLGYDNQKAKQSAINSEPTSLSGSTATIVTGHTWGTTRHVPLSNQELNKVKANAAYSQVINSQLGPQSLLFPSSPPNIGNHMSSHLESFRQMQNYQMAGLPPISSPPNLIYNTQPQMSGPALSFAQQMKNHFPQVMAQLAAASPATAYHQHQNITLMPHQNNTLSQPNIYMTPNQPSVNQSVADNRYRMTAAHQNLATAPHVMKSQFTVQPTAAQAALHRIPVATSTAFYSNQAQPGYFQHTNAAGSTLQQQQAYGYATPQQQLLANPSQVNPQQSYRNVPVAIGRSDASTMRSPNGKYNYR
ncbi:protein PRRC2C-like isoform X3 [Leptotrombidium deliense]|uniref:Protein PRRC2C-like isoform X3 n=1 Tax=Leptotrombidium deliense TaxID=299467 RepID=A0A443ST34_9ACAR|nr:protein PRRC2C-like isoform X3 [Leptotrombidium deliense]